MRSVFACCEARRDRKRRELSNRLIRRWSRNRIAATVRIDDRFLAVPRQPQPHGSRNHRSSVRREPRGNCPVERRHSLIIEPCRNWSAHDLSLPVVYNSYTAMARVGAPPPSLRQGLVERPGKSVAVASVASDRRPFTTPNGSVGSEDRPSRGDRERTPNAGVPHHPLTRSGSRIHPAGRPS